jgi:sugar lactone lactonase YvrE
LACRANGSRHRAILVAVATACTLLLAHAAVAVAYTAAPGFVAHDYVTGLPESLADRTGPIGIAFDASNNLYIADTAVGDIYVFQPGGGVASAATRLNSTPIPGKITGLVFSKTGQLYLARYGAGDVVQVDPGTGRILRTVATIPCATGLVVDPASGDLFVSENLCGNTIWRVSNFGTGPGTATAYASAPAVDGMAFDKDGSLYAESAGTIMKIDGTGSPTPGAVTSLAHVPHADGVAFGAHVSGSPPFVVTNRNDGIVTRVDLTKTPPTQQDIFTGGTRGDFAAVDSAGCLYITQSSSIVRITGTGNTCAFEPTTPGIEPPPGVTITLLGPQPKACTRVHSLKFRIRQRGRVRLRSAKVYVNGRLIKKISGPTITAPIVLHHLPKSNFRLKVVAITAHGKKVRVTRRFVENCSCSKIKVLTLHVPHHRGRAVRVVVYVNGHRVKVVRGRNVTKIAIRKLPHGRFTVKLVIVNAQGSRTTTRRTFLRC